MKNMKNSLFSKFAAALAVGFGALAAAPSAKAVSVLSIWDGVTLTTVADGGAGDLNPAAGIVTALISTGIWTGSVETGFSMPSIGSAFAPQLDLNFSALSSGAGTLTLLWSTDGFLGPVPTGGYQATIGGTLAGPGGNTVDYSTFYDDANVIPAATPLTGSQIFTHPGGSGSYPFSGGVSGTAVGLTPPFSMTQQVVINHTGSGVQITTGNANLSVPDGGMTLTLLGSAMLGFGMLRRKFALR